MRFMTRSLLAIVILTVTLGLLMLAGGQMMRSVSERDAREARQRPQQEREFTVNVDTIALGSATPTITAYGNVASWRTLEIRATVPGRLIDVADEFRDGGTVDGGATLVQIDRDDALADQELARTQVREAEAELLEARADLDIAQAELDAATEQLALREQALVRQNDLKARGVGSDAAVETASLNRSSAIQTELSRKQALAQAQARILRAEIGLSRQEIALEDAARNLADTEITAPFDGILTGVTAIRGRLVGANEKLGELIDPAALEVEFRVSNAQFSRLIDGRGQLLPEPIQATLDLAGAPIVVSGVLDRAGADVGDGQTGRRIYARIDTSDANVLRPGDFMRVEITEPPLQNVAIVPATAATADGRMLFLVGEDRLEEVKATILRRQIDQLIVTGVPEGGSYVTKLQPQLGAGVKVKAVRPGAEIEDKQMVSLSDDDRARYIAAVEGNAYMPQDAKDRVLAQLKEPLVPADTVARLAERLGGPTTPPAGGGDAAPAAASDTVTLDDARREKLIAFVEGNTRMPADAKTRVLAQLQSPEVPKELVERLESRMGG